VSTVPPSAPAPLIVPADSIVPGRARGRGPLRREGPAKLTGEARYADDLVFPGAWYGATIRSTEAHARLHGFDRDDAFDWSKVVFVTADAIPGDNIVSLISDDQPVLVPTGGEIQHHAEPLALIAASDRATLRAAKAAVKPRTEPLEPVFDPVVSEHVFAHYEIATGDLEAGFAQADIVLEGTYTVGHQEQLYIENNAMIAVPEENGGLTVYGSLQCPYYIHKAMKRALALDDIRTRVVQAETGGGFGGKEEYPSIIAIHAALLARACRKPVRMIYDRHEDISATTKRHPAVVTHRTAMRRDGTLLAQDIDVVMDGGAYCTLTPVVLSRGALHAGGPYRCPSVRIRSRATRTNTPPNGAFRGFGAPQTEFAAETHLNRLAEAAGDQVDDPLVVLVLDVGGERIGELAEPDYVGDRSDVDGHVDLLRAQTRIDVVAHEAVGNRIAQEVVGVAERDQVGLAEQAIRVVRPIGLAVGRHRVPDSRRLEAALQQGQLVGEHEDLDVALLKRRGDPRDLDARLVDAIASDGPGHRLPAGEALPAHRASRFLAAHLPERRHRAAWPSRHGRPRGAIPMPACARVSGDAREGRRGFVGCAIAEIRGARPVLAPAPGRTVRVSRAPRASAATRSGSRRRSPRLRRRRRR